jgi:hypothetical protein
MIILRLILFLPILFVYWSCTTSEIREKESLAISNYALEVIDSVVVDYIGVVDWSHIRTSIYIIILIPFSGYFLIFS